MDKDEILTTYLNVSPFVETTGDKISQEVEAAAQGIFGVSAKDLDSAPICFYCWLATESDCLFALCCGWQSQE